MHPAAPQIPSLGRWTFGCLMHKRHFLGLALALLLGAIAYAQEPGAPAVSRAPLATLQAPLPAEPAHPQQAAPPLTPELWFYSQELRRHDDPAQAVRRKAEIKADQRMSRIAAAKWFGFSNSRPHAWGLPFVSASSPHWPGNGLERHYWATVSYPGLMLRLENAPATAR